MKVTQDFCLVPQFKPRIFVSPWFLGIDTVLTSNWLKWAYVTQSQTRNKKMYVIFWPFYVICQIAEALTCDLTFLLIFIHNKHLMWCLSNLK